MQQLLIVLCLLLLAACQGTTEPTAPMPTPTEVPWPAHDFTLELLNGGNVTLSDLQGRWVLLNFWATWCVPCRTEMPALQIIASDYRRDLVVLGINQREDAQTVRDFTEEVQVTFPIALNPDDVTLVQYNVMGLPRTFLINPDGNIVHQFFGPIELHTFRPLLDSLI